MFFAQNESRRLVLELPTFFVTSCQRPHLLTLTDDVSLAVTCCLFKVKAEWEVEEVVEEEGGGEDFRSGAIHSSHWAQERTDSARRAAQTWIITTLKIIWLHLLLPKIYYFYSKGYVVASFPPSLLHAAGTREYIQTLLTFLMTWTSRSGMRLLLA